MKSCIKSTLRFPLKKMKKTKDCPLLWAIKSHTMHQLARAVTKFHRHALYNRLISQPFYGVETRTAMQYFQNHQNFFLRSAQGKWGMPSNIYLFSIWHIIKETKLNGKQFLFVRYDLASYLQTQLNTYCITNIDYLGIVWWKIRQA